MADFREIALPGAVALLEEANLPGELAQALAGASVSVEVLPEEPPATRRVERDDFPLLMDPDGNYWNDYQPVRILFTDPHGNVWHLPRRWLEGIQQESDVRSEASGAGAQAIPLTEKLHLPSYWDLVEINIPKAEAVRAAGKETTVQVHVGPTEPAKLFWRDSTGKTWRLPHDWRRRRIMLPGYAQLLSEDIPAEVAEKYAHKIVSVNYHPGSLCCLPEHYRFRDEEANRWPVQIRDCVFLGYGDARAYQG